MCVARWLGFLAKAQLLVLDAGGTPQWRTFLLDTGARPVEPGPPPPKRQRQGPSWDEVRARLQGKQQQFDGVLYVRLLDLFVAISLAKTNKNPGQKVATYTLPAGWEMSTGMQDFQFCVYFQGFHF